MEKGEEKRGGGSRGWRWRVEEGVRRGGAKWTALNTHSSTRPTGTLFPCKFCLLSVPLPLSYSSLFLSIIYIYIFSPSHLHDSRRVPLRTLVLRSPFPPVTSRGKRCDARNARVHTPFAHIYPLFPIPHISHLATKPRRSTLYIDFILIYV